jgi:hypothetical protein
MTRAGGPKAAHAVAAAKQDHAKATKAQHRETEWRVKWRGACWWATTSTATRRFAREDDARRCAQRKRDQGYDVQLEARDVLAGPWGAR